MKSRKKDKKSVEQNGTQTEKQRSQEEKEDREYWRDTDHYFSVMSVSLQAAYYLVVGQYLSFLTTFRARDLMLFITGLGHIFLQT